MQIDQSHFERKNQHLPTFFGLYLFRPITRALLPSFGTTSVRIAFISINLVGRLAWWLRRALETRLAALVSGVVRRKNAARVLPPFDGDPGSMIKPGRSWASRLAELKVLSSCHSLPARPKSRCKGGYKTSRRTSWGVRQESQDNGCRVWGGG